MAEQQTRAKTPLDLYRQGNASSPRMDNVRTKDIEIYEQEGQIWVNPSLEGGISTFAAPRSGKNWWKLEQGTEIPPQLTLVNDYGNHWLWKPREVMPLEEYKAALREIGDHFAKVN